MSLSSSYEESTKRIIDRECSDVKKHERDLVENAEALAWHEESVATELRRDLRQARMQVSRGSGLAEQQQRQLESALVEPMPECLGTLRIKAASDPFRVSSLAFGSPVPAAPEQTHRVCGPGALAADVGDGAARWAIPAPRNDNIADEDSSEEPIGEETDRRRAVVKPIDLGRPPTGPEFQSWLAEFYMNGCAASNRSWRRTMRFLKAVEMAPTHETLEMFVHASGSGSTPSLRRRAFDSHLARCFAGSRCTEMLFSGGVWMCLVVLLCGLSCRSMLSRPERFSRSDCRGSLDSLSQAILVSSWTA